MRPLVRNAVALALLFFLQQAGWAFGMPRPKPLSQILANSDVVAIAHLQSTSAHAPEGSRKSGSGLDVFLALSTFYTAGHYSIEVKKCLKGDMAGTVELDFPALVSLSYGDAFSLNGDRNILVLLKQNGGKYVATDPQLPFVPLSVGNTVTGTDPGVVDQVVSLLIYDLQFPASRRMVVFLLRNLRLPRVVVALAPYAKDENLHTRDLVLSALAHSGQLGVIPLIRDLNRALRAQRSGAESVADLGAFSGVKEAVPALNPLLFEPEQYMRINALSAISRTADTSSVPYLLLSLYDPEPQNMNAPTAFALLQNVSGTTSQVDQANFAKQRTRAAADFTAWWRAELAGQHQATGERAPEVALHTGQLYEAKDLATLHAGLFVHSAKTRDVAVKSLYTLGDQTSAPYLIVALSDPESDIAYQAYRALQRVVPSLEMPASRAQFDNHRDELSTAAISWWVHYLNDAERNR